MSVIPKPLPWQQELWVEVTALALQDRLGHALLLSGPAGVGKRAFAKALTAFLLCEQRSGYACGRCRSCEQLAAGAHPNSIVLALEVDDKTGKQKRDISVEQVREFSERLQLTSHYGQAKVATIDPADALNAAGVNALLKTIEEPSGHTHVLLISERAMALPATLRSRCQRLQFAPPAQQEAMAWLHEHHPEVGEQTLALAHGAPLRAAELAQSGLVERYASWEKGMSDLAAGRGDPLALAAAIAKEKDDVPAYFSWLQLWLAGLLRGAVGAAPKKLALPAPALQQMMREAIDAQRRLGGNAVPQLLLESVIVLWWRLARPVKAA
ncbi:MAG TPA: DNA polymerase III subunit delta' [Nevskiaceae bacterium]|nr:DNA polymerase III subunit delta' [Nevskiaceae bacterium]